MNHSLTRNLLFQISAFLILAVACMAQDAPQNTEARAKITSQIQTLHQQLTRVPVADEDWKETKPEIETALEQAEGALHAGHTYLSLEELGAAEIGFHAMQASKDESDRRSFSSKWEKSKLELT